VFKLTSGEEEINQYDAKMLANLNTDERRNILEAASAGDYEHASNLLSRYLFGEAPMTLDRYLRRFNVGKGKEIAQSG
jgi:hypothetical protein